MECDGHYKSVWPLTGQLQLCILAQGQMWTGAISVLFMTYFQAQNSYPVNSFPKNNMFPHVCTIVEGK